MPECVTCGGMVWFVSNGFEEIPVTARPDPAGTLVVWSLDHHRRVRELGPTKPVSGETLHTRHPGHRIRRYG